MQVPRFSTNYLPNVYSHFTKFRGTNILQICPLNGEKRHDLYFSGTSAFKESFGVFLTKLQLCAVFT